MIESNTSGLMPLALAPVLRKDVVDVDVLAEEDRVIELLAGTKILRAFLHQQGVDALVGGGQTHPHRLESVGAEHAFR